MQANLQADLVTAKRSVEGLSDIIMSNDSDLFLHNPQYVLIHKFKKKR